MRVRVSAYIGAYVTLPNAATPTRRPGSQRMCDP